MDIGLFPIGSLRAANIHHHFRHRENPNYGLKTCLKYVVVQRPLCQNSCADEENRYLEGYQMNFQ